MSDKGGFTLIELILVTVIIGILAGMVTFSITGRVQDASIKAARGDIANYGSVIEHYALDHNGLYPKQLQELIGGEKEYVRQLNVDPWGNPYVYECPGKKHPKSYDIYSAGPDGQPGTEDDITEEAAK
jgi:general secretion pathway protein G